MKPALKFLRHPFQVAETITNSQIKLPNLASRFFNNSFRNNALFNNFN